MSMVAQIAGVVMACGLACGQTFEVASVKPAPPPDGRGRSVTATGVPGSPYGKDPGRFRAVNFSLPNLITMAYDIPFYRLSGADGLHMIMFNIEARMPVDTTKEQFEVMLQNLLADRFGLKVHWQTRQMALYELTVAKGGPKLKDGHPDTPVEDGDAESQKKNVSSGPPKRGDDGYPVPPPGNQRWMAIMGDKAIMRGHNETAADMASAFSNQVGSPVTDATGLSGMYDYTVQWSAAATSALRAAAPAAGSEPDGPTLFQALQEQLGLKLESKKGPVQVLVVDHVDTKPTEN